MFGFGSTSSSSSSQVPDNTMASRKREIMQHIQNETTITAAQELMNTSTERCFKSCVINPGPSLTLNEQTCLTSCFDKYLDAFNTVSRAYGGRVRSELASSGVNKDSEITLH